MIVLKAQTFDLLSHLTKFVNENGIRRENILEITHGKTLNGSPIYTVFFYGDAATEERVPGFWG